MLEGWYCRSLANEQQPNQRENMADDSLLTDDSQMDENSDRKNAGLDYRAQYRYLKRKLKFLIYENEFFQEALRSNQRRLLKVSRDRAFLLDRLLHYEKPEMVSSEDEETESSDDDAAKRRKIEGVSQQPVSAPPSTGQTRGRKRKVPVGGTVENVNTEMQEKIGIETTDLEMQQGHMTAAEVERHLQSKQPVMELMPEHAPTTVPTEMFSNEPSLDSESNDHHLIDGSPTHVAAEECVPMEYTSDM